MDRNRSHGGLRAAWNALLTPPYYADAALGRRAASLHAILLAVFAVYSAGIVIGVPFVFDRKLEGGMTLLLALTMAAVAWACMRRGRVRLGSHVIAWTMWMVPTAVVVLSAQALNAAMYVAPVFIVAVLFGVWWAGASAAAGIAVTLAATHAGPPGIAVPGVFPALPHTQAFVFALQICMAIVSFAIILRWLDRALARADRELERRRRAARKLAASEERLAVALDGARTGIWDWQVQTGKLIANPHAEAIFGLREGHFGGTFADFLRLVHPDDARRVAAFGSLVLEGRQQRRSIEHRILLPDGSVRWIEGRGVMHRDAAGRPLRVVGTVTDVTERKQAEAQLRFRLKLDALIRRISQRFLVVPHAHTGPTILETLGEVGRFAAADRCYISRLDESGETYTLAEEWCAEGIPSKRAVRRAVPAADLWRDLERDHIAYVTASELPADSPVRRVMESAGIRSSLRVAIRSEGRLAGVLGIDAVRQEKRWPDDVSLLLRVVADIAGGALERERADAQIRLLNADLERRVRERTLDLETANKELESFSYSVSHDLRSSVRRVEGFIRMLMLQHGARLDEQGAALLARVRGQAQHMGRLIDDLLRLARVNRQEIHRSPVDLSAVAREVIAGLVAAEPERRVAATVDDGITAMADPGLMRVVLDNLLGNAWKFTGKTPAATIEFTTAEVAGETVYCVRDNGAGFDMAGAGNLFGPFQRLHLKEEFDGTGVGLATVHRIIVRHGGRIWAESTPAQGAAFHFTLGTR